MRRNVAIPTIAIVTAAAVLAGFGQVNAEAQGKLASDEEREAYSLGVVVATQAAMGLGDVNHAAFVAGVRDAIKQNELALDDSEISEALIRFDERRAEEARVALEARIEANRGAGDAFREKFAKDPEVETLASGLLYKVLKAGRGEKPAAGSTVTLHYRGSLVDGREIDSSYARDEPITLQLDRAIPGWTEALSRMPLGSKWQVVVPPELAYGEYGAGSLIEPGATLVFEMELISAS